MQFETRGSVEESWGDALSSVAEIIDDAPNGRMFILVDHEDRENEGDLVGAGHKGRAAEFSDAMRLIDSEGRGVAVLLRDTAQKINDTVSESPSKLRQYGLGAQILSSLGLPKLELLTNSPWPKVVGLEAYGVEITSIRKISETG